jgi:hypothetical protein
LRNTELEDHSPIRIYDKKILLIFCQNTITIERNLDTNIGTRGELLPTFKFTGKTVKNFKFTDNFADFADRVLTRYRTCQHLGRTSIKEVNN